MIKFSFPSGDYKTLTGLIYQHMERVPQVGDTVQLPGCKIIVESMQEHRITQVRFERSSIDQAQSSTAAATTEKSPEHL